METKRKQACTHSEQSTCLNYHSAKSFYLNKQSTKHEWKELYHCPHATYEERRPAYPTIQRQSKHDHTRISALAVTPKVIGKKEVGVGNHGSEKFRTDFSSPTRHLRTLDNNRRHKEYFTKYMKENAPTKN
ncbi:hypothetical protein ACOSP7_030852 [Xanthoceras sorbifolium]